MLQTNNDFQWGGERVFELHHAFASPVDGRGDDERGKAARHCAATGHGEDLRVRTRGVRGAAESEDSALCLPHTGGAVIDAHLRCLERRNRDERWTHRESG